MLKVIKTISNVRSFSVVGNFLLYVNKEFDLYKNDLFISSNVIDIGYAFLNNQIIFLKNSDTVIENEVLENLSFVQNSKNLIDNTIVLSGEFKLKYPDFSNNYYLFELNSKKKIFICEFQNLYYFFRQEGRLFFSDKNSIHAYTLPTATPLWQFDMGCLGMYETYKGEVKQYIVEKFIGVWEEELLVACSNGLILCIAISTGIEKRRWQQLEGYYPDVQGVSNKLPRTENFILDSQTNILIALHIFSVVIINLLTGDIEVIDMEQELRRLDVNLLKNNSSYGIDDGYIYTTATMAYSDDKSQWTYDCLLAINRNTYKVDWQYKFKEESLGTNTPQLSGDKLYQLTASNTLYIFEKENT